MEILSYLLSYLAGFLCLVIAELILLGVPLMVFVAGKDSDDNELRRSEMIWVWIGTYVGIGVAAAVGWAGITLVAAGS